MDSSALAHCCRACGATSYRQVIARDDSGAMCASGLYRCSGCSAVFTDPRAWRNTTGEPAPAPANPPPVFKPNVTALSGHATTPQSPNFATYGLTPLGTSAKN